MNKQKGVLNLKNLITFKNEMANIRPPFHPDVSDAPSDFSNIDPEIRKAMDEGRPF